jgi:hypothetical protein
VRRDTAASSAATTGDNATINTDGNGLLWTRTMDPCMGGATKVTVPIDIATATTTELINGTGASLKAYVCGLFLGPTAGAQNIALIEDDTDACASPTAGLMGGVTASEGFNIAANGGTNIGNGAGTVAISTANRYVCLITSAAQQVSGTFVYVLAP